MRRHRSVISVLLGALLLLAGIALLVAAPGAGAADFGWFAYTPLDAGRGAPGDITGLSALEGAVLASRAQVAGAGVVVLGLLVVVGVLAFRAGRRSAAIPATPADGATS